MKEDFALQEKRDKEQREHERQLAEIEAKIVREREAIRDAQLSEERRNAIVQKEKDLDDATKIAAQARQPQVSALSRALKSTTSSAGSPAVASASVLSATMTKSTTSSTTSVVGHGVTPSAQGTPPEQDHHVPGRAPPPQISESRDEWERQKRVDGASNDAIDAIMAMTGLEKVKSQVLDIKAAVDTARRQGTSISKNRYNLSCLGNPGTGMT